MTKYYTHTIIGLGPIEPQKTGNEKCSRCKKHLAYVAMNYGELKQLCFSCCAEVMSK